MQPTASSVPVIAPSLRTSISWPWSLARVIASGWSPRSLRTASGKSIPLRGQRQLELERLAGSPRQAWSCVHVLERADYSSQWCPM